MMQPTVGRIVHYQAYGTPGGEHPKACRAAIVTEVDTRAGAAPSAVTRPADVLLSLAVLNPTGLFFDQRVPWAPPERQQGGTWHFPEGAKATGSGARVPESLRCPDCGRAVDRPAAQGGCPCRPTRTVPTRPDRL